MVIAQRVSTLTDCIRTSPTVAVVVVAVAGRAPHSFIMPAPPFTDEHFIIIITTGNPAQRIHDHGHRAVRGLGWSV